MTARSSGLHTSAYLTFKNAAEAELKIKKSRFIALSYPVSTTSECNTLLSDIKRRFHDARHVCFAYRLGHGSAAVNKYSDAGEPSGTAGSAIARVIEGENLTNVFVAVVRYFGGTKLGTGGLTRAYTELAQSILNESKIVRVDIVKTLKLKTSYVHLDAIMHELNTGAARVRDKDFTEAIHLTFEVPVSNLDQLLNRLNEITSGEIELTSIEEQSSGNDKQ